MIRSLLMVGFIIALVDGQDVTDIKDVNTPFPANAVFPVPDFAQNVPLNYLRFTNDAIVMKSAEEISAIQAAADAAWQSNKTATLKAIENIYVAFLTNDWTLCLRGYGIVSNDFTVYVTNTSESANTTYLMQLRTADTNSLKPTYSFYAGEFDRFKYAIVQNGGIMSKVQTH